LRVRGYLRVKVRQEVSEIGTDADPAELIVCAYPLPEATAVSNNFPPPAATLAKENPFRSIGFWRALPGAMLDSFRFS